MSLLCVICVTSQLHSPALAPARCGQAIDRASPGSAIYLPEGRYVITKRVDIRKQVVLRGAGRDKTALFYPKSLADLYGNRGGWGHGTCFINFWGW